MVKSGYECMKSCVDASKTWDECQSCRIARTAPCNQAPFNSNVKRTTSDPTANDDEDDGYKPGDKWINTSDNGVFILVDDSAGSAVWKELSFV